MRFVEIIRSLAPVICLIAGYVIGTIERSAK